MIFLAVQAGDRSLGGQFHPNMPPFRLILILIGCVGIPTLLTFSTLLQSHPSGEAASDTNPEVSKSNFRSFFSFHTPSTLFPPSAIISLTDDNSTFFLARPADFGPLLAADGMSGQLWIGSGFGDGGHGESSAEGELGCSDVPGWDVANQQHRRDHSMLEGGQTPQKRDMENGNRKMQPEDVKAMSKAAVNSMLEFSEPNEDDGTDDYLHHPLPSSAVSKPTRPGEPAEREPNFEIENKIHGDIQSLQESAEISGKVVLLSRGGCGFLEKVKWAQRRGAVALVVGDHTRGGALVTMYARGDTSNVSIPSVFTSHTTAHLLASLFPAEKFTIEHDEEHYDGLGPDDSSRVDNRKPGAVQAANEDKPTFTPAGQTRSTSIASARSRAQLSNSRRLPLASNQKSKGSWFRTVFGSGRSEDLLEKSVENTRPPSSGRLDWFTPKWSDKGSKEAEAKTSSKKEKGNSKPLGKDTWWPGSHSSSNDGFEIGVQDWRDPDLVAKSSPVRTTAMSSTLQTPLATASLLGKSGKDEEQEKGTSNLLSGGSITPGSGQYQNQDQNSGQRDKDRAPSNRGEDRKYSGSTDGHKLVISSKMTTGKEKDLPPEEHEGLWVTITPTTMSTSPFFDTLLVLVVSPLVTLTVVYALLLLRSRIRRRRWRAPKSVVDRLPIRTYQTMSCSTTTSSTRFTSPHSSSAHSPQRQPSQRSITRTRPRSATASGIGEAVSASLERAAAKPSFQEKTARDIQSKRKYTGRQIECVVCLEEYVDGKSKVMSLPCGHEFHAECM